jgi:hypothetical protein
MKPLDILEGFKAFRARARSGECPTCGKRGLLDFRDDLSRREHDISGLCQDCQDIYFAPQGDVES